MRKHTDIAMTPEQQESEARLRKNIQYTVENGLGVRADDVTALAQAPSDGVQEPQEDSPSTADRERLSNIGAESIGMSSGLEDDSPCDEQERSASEDEVSPLVVGLDKSANKTSHNHDLIHENGVRDRGPRKTRGKQQIKQQQRRSNEPVDVAHVEDLTLNPGDEVAGTLKFDVDRCPAEVGGHAEVGDGGDQRDSGSNIMEETLSARLASGHGEDGESGHGHDSGYGLNMSVGADGCGGRE